MERAVLDALYSIVHDSSGWSGYIRPMFISCCCNWSHDG